MIRLTLTRYLFGLMLLSYLGLAIFIAGNNIHFSKALFSTTPVDYKSYHDPVVLHQMMQNADTLSADTNAYYAASGLCVQCHDTDTTGFAMVDSNGRDVNMIDEWRATMMANSAKDPFWRAKVSHEIEENPGHMAALEDKCTSCHAPMGHYESRLNAQSYTLAQMDQDAIALDGVNCVGCHMMVADSLGIRFSREPDYDRNRQIYGPYPTPIAAPMSNAILFDPAFGAHVSHEGFCASCHTLITETVDSFGNYTGDEFIEQATYHEWLNSSFRGIGEDCQDCHMPRLNDNIVISSQFPLPARSPYGQHHLVGGNVFMLELMKNYIDTLNLTAEKEHFDSVIQRTTRLLQEETMQLALTELSRTNDTAFYELELANDAGHKFPSGYPSRRMFVEFMVRDRNRDTLFHSGEMTTDYMLPDHDSGYEPHYIVINREDQVQIYEMVIGDVYNKVTTVLEKGKAPLKDNRIPPGGFTTFHFAYDTVKIVGNALSDPDFNRAGAVQGTGLDVLHFHIPMKGYTGDLVVNVRAWYQSVPPRWTWKMFSHSTPEIDHFKSMYQSTDGTPVLIDSVQLGSFVGRKESLEQMVMNIYPNPVIDNRFNIQLKEKNEKLRLRIFNMEAKLLKSLAINKMQTQIDFAMPAGTYILEFSTSQKRWRQKLIKL